MNENILNRKLISKKFIKKFILDIMQIILGAAIMGVGVSLFLLPNQLSSGGFTGISTVFYYLFRFQVGTVNLVLNIPFFIFGLFKLGKEFFVKTLVGTVSLSMFIDLFDKYNQLTNDKVLACIYGGCILGLGTALVLRAYGSTGGTDLIANLIRHYKPNFRTSEIIVVFDIIVVTLNVIVFRKIEIGLYSAVAIYLYGKVIDIFFEGIYFTKMMFIISTKYEEIAEKVGKEVKRGATGIYAKGMYSKDEKMMLLCIGSRGEVLKIKQIARKIDPNSFIVISNAREAFGIGFKE